MNRNSVKHLFLVILMMAFVPASIAQDLDAAKKLTDREQFDEAEVAYKALVAKEPNNGAYFFYYGENFFKNYFADSISNSLADVLIQAEIFFKKGSQADANHPLNYVGLGKVALFKTNAAEAQAQFEKAKSFLPKYIVKKGKVKYQSENPLPAQLHAIVLAKMGEAYIRANNTDTAHALPLLREAQILDPKNPEIFIITGDIYLEIADGSLAILNYNKAQTLDPKNPKAKMKIGNIYVRGRNLNAAIPYFEEALTIDPNYAPVYRELGELYAKAGKIEKSKSNYKQFLVLSGDNLPAKVSYIKSLFKSKKDYDETLLQIESVLAVDQSRNYLYRLAAYSCWEIKTCDAAKGLDYIETFFKNSSAEKILPNDFLYLGRFIVKTQKKTKDSVILNRGFENLEKAFSYDEKDIKLANEIAKNYYDFKRYAQSAVWYEKKIAIAYDENDHLKLGKAYYFAQDFEKAESTLNDLLAKNPENISGYEWLGNSLTKKDPDLKQGLAKPIFETLIEKAKASADPKKYNKEMVNAYTYLGSYYLGIKKDFPQAKAIYLKIAEIDPANTKAKAALESKVLINVKPKEN